MILRVTQYGEPVLREKGKPVSTFDNRLRQLADDMVETMRAEEGVGLAAQQIGRAIRLCVVDVSHLPDSELEFLLDGKRPPIELIMPMALVNPKIERLPGKVVPGEEGCLSFPGVRGIVHREHAVRVEFQDLSGHAHILEASGWLSRVVQHEGDHLEGRLFIDHMDNRSLRMLDTRLKKLKRESRDFLKSGSGHQG